MPIPDETRYWIEESVRQLVRGTPTHLTPEITAAIDHSALPVYHDLGGVLLIRPTGEVVAVDPESSSTTILQPGEAMHTIALVAGAAKHPQLTPLLPKRPAAASTCVTCAGHGQRSIGSSSAFCGDCSGLGWLTDAA